MTLKMEDDQIDVKRFSRCMLNSGLDDGSVGGATGRLIYFRWIQMISNDYWFLFSFFFRFYFFWIILYAMNHVPFRLEEIKPYQKNANQRKKKNKRRRILKTKFDTVV